MTSRTKIAAFLAFGVAAGFFLNMTLAIAESGKAKHCGTVAGANNGSCPECVSNCDFTDDGKTQKYKVCAGDGSGCKDDRDAFCSGRLMSGGADGDGCDGINVLDDFGRKVSCQNDSFKTCKTP